MKRTDVILKTVIALFMVVAFLNCKNQDTSKNQNDESHQHNQEHNHANDGDHDHKHPHDNSASEKQMVQIEFKDEETKKLFQSYIEIKEALVAGDSKKVTSGALILGEQTKNEILVEALGAIIKTDNIETQRNSFAKVTEQVEGMVKGALVSGEIYKQYCPMAFNNEGGSWLSIEKEIKNPYFGDRMLKCGKVTETIK
ncbi:DUF3347 domain-containing protein [Aquimarina pacifica]|uniref:DUF3347 domain-containing protein n=1 Tax=Aquimarina pacifica TaxID=1296415 RepID=UPI0004710C98|nr:DUF3347 domain-containing protein [Aquimarina pacifica]